MSSFKVQNGHTGRKTGTAGWHFCLVMVVLKCWQNLPLEVFSPYWFSALDFQTSARQTVLKLWCCENLDLAASSEGELFNNVSAPTRRTCYVNCGSIFGTILQTSRVV